MSGKCNGGEVTIMWRYKFFIAHKNNTRAKRLMVYLNGM